jgi:heme/copper-type cytochrome/quinol oxidase subunit 4
VDPFSYIIVLTSIVLGLGVTRSVGGLGHLMQRGQHGRVYWVHVVWVVNMILLTAIVWWTAYRWRITARWTFPLFLWLLLAPTLLYLISSLLIPDQEERRSIANWQTYFFDNHRRIFLLLASMFPLDLIDTFLKGAEHFRAQGPLYLATMILWTVLCLTAAFTKRKVFHAGFAVFFLIYNLIFVGATALTDQSVIGGAPH